MPSTDLDILRHQEWLGLLQPVGLVVSPPALIKARAVIDRAKLVDLQERLQGVVSTEAIPRHGDEGIAWIENFPAFTQKVLDWMPEDLVAQRCLYGVDKNPFAVNLAKLSLWLVTLAKDQPFTFVDHALKCGDSLVGLTRSEYADLVRTWRQSVYTQGDPTTPPPHHPTTTPTPSPLTEIQNSLRNAEKPITPFNWEIEFPEVFDRRKKVQE
jgi:hypothetical protein